MKYREMHFTCSQEHGLGIRYLDDSSDTLLTSVFYEDGGFYAGKEEKEFDKGIEQMIDKLTDSREIHWAQPAGREEAACRKLLETGMFRFELNKANKLEAIVEDGKNSFRIIMKIVEGRYYKSIQLVCSCAKERCIHRYAAGLIARERLKALKHKYVISSQPVDKSLFLEEELKEAISKGVIYEFDEATMERFHDIVRKIDIADSADYYRTAHDFILGMAPYDYDSHFLEDYAYLLLAVFEDKKYYKAVIEPGGYADPQGYEGRQHKSNRVCFKRILKDYESVRKELDVRGDYSEDEYKEFLLKYRGDDCSLLRYYAYGKKKLSTIDIPYLKRIAAEPEAEKELIAIVAEKADVLGTDKEGIAVFRKLMERLSHEERIRIYSRLKNISLSTEEIHSLSKEEQLKLIRNTPLTAESFLHIMEKLMPEQEDADKGRFILGILDKVRFSQDNKLKNLIAEKASELADSRLLLAYVVFRLMPAGAWRAPDGDPERELNTYFACGYEMENEKSSISVSFLVRDPESDFELMKITEYEGKVTRRSLLSKKLFDIYPDELLRKVCLAGREETFARELEKNQDEVETYLFEKNNKKFAAAYRMLCNGFEQEKILFRAAQRAKIEWLVFREKGSNALAFKVGNSKQYVVKDAAMFIDAFRNNQTVEYGKDLILTHDPDNLNEDDAGMIKLLMAAKFTKGRKTDQKNKRYISVSDSVLGNLLEQLNGRMIYYNDQPCRIRLEGKRIRLKIGKNYALSTDLKAGKQEYLNLMGKGYLVSRAGDTAEAAAAAKGKDAAGAATAAKGKDAAAAAKGEDAAAADKGKDAAGAAAAGKGKEMAGVSLVIDRVEASPDEAALIEFVDQNSGVSVKPILKDFRKNVYSRFFELFDVDGAAAQDFRVSEIRINSYFDYEKSVITLRMELWKDEKQIRPEALSDRIDLVKYELLRKYLGELGFVNGVLEEESRILSFFKMDFTRLKSLTNVYLSDALQMKELKTVGRPVIRVTYKNDMMQVFLEKSDYSEAELEKILAGIRRKKKFILLDGNRIIDLDNDAAKDFGETVKDFDLDPKDLYRKKTISMVTAIKAFAHEKSCRVDKYLRDMIEDIRSFKESDIPVPKLNGELRGYQMEGYHWMSILSRYGMGGILADDMGLGKTIQVIALIKADKTKKPSLVVCPKSLVFNWVSEFARFDGKIKVEEIYGTDSVRSEKIASIDYKEKAVYITSYDSLRNDIGKYTGEFNYGILDEAQYIKNVNALKTKSVKELRANHRFALTGTPIENSVVDLWSIFDYIMPGYFEELSWFKNSDTSVIARKAAPFILRRVKNDVLEDLPPKYERILTAEMTQEQRKLYDAMRRDARRRLEEGGKAFDLLPYLTRLRQICVDPGMFLENYTSGSGKLEMLRSLIPEYLSENHRILIFSQFVKGLESVQRILEENGIPFFFLSGATAAKDRIEMMDSFNSGNGPDVFLISLKAGGTGLNLTGADTVIHLDPWWNVAAENQATDRTHRIGQKRNVEVIRLIAENTIEQRVAELQELKKQVVEQVISDDDGSVTSASLEDLAFVLG